MMIVIPNNFSEKSLSIQEDSPEKVVLPYKINATGHEDVRAEAGRILNDFNRRLIDVYFASIIEKLQEAQDEITEIISKEEVLTGLYNKHIQSPLENFTNQFDHIETDTNRSKDFYLNLEEMVMSFEEDLIEEVENNANYLADTFTDFLDKLYD